MIQILQCPCQSEKLYKDCCYPFHQGLSTVAPESHILPHTAEQLMRSRYSAFVVADIDYIVQTTLPTQQKLLDKPALAQWSKETIWAGLEILEHTKISKCHSHVEFKAFFDTEDGRQYHHELSTFVRITDIKNTDSINANKSAPRWYFIDPNALEKMDISQKKPCICNSGDKFKRCCGKFLDI